MTTVAHLPEDIILRIFSYLPLKEICHTASVCKRWLRIGSDHTLWAHVDVTPIPLTMDGVYKILRPHLSERTQSLKMEGSVHGSFAKPNPRDASEALLKDVQERCPNIHTLLLDHCWLDNANASLLLLPSLHTLEFVWCRLPEGLFRSNAIELLKNLKVLKLYNMTSDADMPHISKLCQLEVLDIRSSRVTDDGLKPIAENLTCLKELYISDTDYSDLGVYHISRGLKNLKVLEMALSVSVFNEVSDLSMYSLASGLPNLTHLYIDGCKNITLEGLLEVVDNLKELEAFHISRIYTLPDFVNCFPQMPRLKDVEIGEIDAEALMVLSQLDLVSLAVDVTGVNCMEFCHLHNCTTLRKLSLHSYTLGSDTVVDSCIEELKANLPFCEVVTSGYSLLPDDEL